MNKSPAQIITDEMLNAAKNNYDLNQIFEALDDPLLINDLDTALLLCQRITEALRYMGMKEGSFLDKMILRLTDYISRQEGHGD
ncbi:hypothetical protein AGMMS49944_05370 [Spirochaetia bacterium]|nr:hypothetical protein AGMMS49944_05370 [Spirochaetia bacterium]